MTSPASAASSRRASARGFTLVEALLTIAVLMVVITLSLAAINKARRTAAMNRVRADFQSLSVALEQYKSDFKRYPARGMADSKSVLAQALAGPGDDDGEKGPGFRIIDGGKVRQPMYPAERTRFVPPQGGPDGEWHVMDAYGYVGEPTFNADSVNRFSGIVQYLPLRDVRVAANAGKNPLPILTAGTSHFERSDIRPPPKPSVKFPETTFQYVLGDLNLNGQLDSGEALTHSGGYLLASPGADGVFTDLSAATDLEQRRQLMRTSDDIYNIAQ